MNLRDALRLSVLKSEVLVTHSSMYGWIMTLSCFPSHSKIFAWNGKLIPNVPHRTLIFSWPGLNGNDVHFVKWQHVCSRTVDYPYSTKGARFLQPYTFATEYGVKDHVPSRTLRLPVINQISPTRGYSVVQSMSILTKLLERNLTKLLGMVSWLATIPTLLRT